MGDTKPSVSVKQKTWIKPIDGGTGTSRLGPPWSRDQVQWVGEGYFVLRLATEPRSRFLVGGAFDPKLVYSHERTFRRSAVEKSRVISNLKMNPWPSHLSCEVDPDIWRQACQHLIKNLAPVVDTGHITLWRVEQLDHETFAHPKPVVILDGHHSREAQRFLQTERVFGWVEPIGAQELHVGAIHRAGHLAKWIDGLLETKAVERVEHPTEDGFCFSGLGSGCFEVIQAQDRFWCRFTKFPNSSTDTTTVVDELHRLAKPAGVSLFAGSDLEQLLRLLESFECDTVIRLPVPSKAVIFARGLAKCPFPQKATYFYPKVPFGTLVANLTGQTLAPRAALR